MQNLVIQSFGRENEYKRAILTIFSFYAHTSSLTEETKILLFTDKPGYFKPFFGELPVEYILLTPAKIKFMRGDIDFLHRMKIALIEEAFGIIKGPMLYLDSDTFFINDPTPLVASVKEDITYMHTCEYQFKEMRHDSSLNGAGAFLKFIENNCIILSEGAKKNISPELNSWNAGVMLLHESHSKLLPQVYALTKQFFLGTESHASEQYAFSIVLQNNTQVFPCDEVVFHYWYKVKKQIMDTFLDEKLNDNWVKLPLSKKVAEVKNWTKVLPMYIKSHVLTFKDNAVLKLSDKNYREGYLWALKALAKQPFGDSKFLKDVLYYLKKQILKNER